MSASYWLIERQVPYHCEWWVSGQGCPFGQGAGGGKKLIEEWTTDASKAQRFNEWGARQHAKELESWGVTGPLTATEHIDCEEPEPATEYKKP